MWGDGKEEKLSQAEQHGITPGEPEKDRAQEKEREQRTSKPQAFCSSFKRMSPFFLENQ